MRPEQLHAVAYTRFKRLLFILIKNKTRFNLLLKLIPSYLKVINLWITDGSMYNIIVRIVLRSKVNLPTYLPFSYFIIKLIQYLILFFIKYTAEPFSTDYELQKERRKKIF